MMRAHLILSAAGIAALTSLAAAQPKTRINPLVDLLAQKKPVFGLYAPSAGRGGGTGAAVPVKTPADLATEALAYENGDILFSGAMEGNFDRGYGPFAELVGELAKSPARLKHPLVTKIPKIAADPAKAIDNISRQLNLGVSTVVFVEVESAEEVRAGLAAMRFASKGGTRPDDTGDAPAFWGMNSDRYKQKADLWPLNREGELINWTIVETREGLAHVREIAAVKGIGVLWPGAGTLRGVFSSTNAAGERVVDAAAWENAIQQVLAACKEFNVPCGFPATANDIEMRIKQGFSVFVMNWGDPGFKAIEIGRKAAGR